MRRATYYIAMLLCLLCNIVNADDHQAVHHALFDLFCPETAVLTNEQAAIREQLKDDSWKKIGQNPQLYGMVDLVAHANEPDKLPLNIQESFPDLLASGFKGMDPQRQRELLSSLRRHEDNFVRLFASRIRLAYLGLGFSPILADRLAGIEPQTPPINEIDLELPPSGLELRDGQIHPMQGDIDYLIVGSGPAGSLIAHELARQHEGLQIVVVEAGSFVIPGTIDTEFNANLMESHNWRTTASGGIALRNGYTVGGGTTVNLDLAFSPLLPCIQKRMSSWVEQGLAKADLFASDKLEAAYEYITSKLGTRQVHEHEINKNNALLWSAGQKYAHTATYQLNQRDPSLDPDEIRKVSAVEGFLLPALLRGPEFRSHVSILPDAKTKRILVERDGNLLKATGIEIEFQQPWDKPYVLKDPNHLQASPGTTATIRAKNVILAAGTLGSASILLHSDIENDQIGKGIVIHPSIGLPARFDEAIDMTEGLPTSVYAVPEGSQNGYFFEAMSADPSFLAMVHPGTGDQIQQVLHDFRKLGGFGIMLVDEVSEENRVALNADTGDIEVHYALSDSDKARFRTAIKTALHLLLDANAREILLPSSEPLLTDGAEYVPFTDHSQVDTAIDRLMFSDNQTILSSAHMQGSNKMGRDARKSVVSPNFRVWDVPMDREIPNLYVADSSIFPTSVGANPMQSIYTVAKRFVDEILSPLEQQLRPVQTMTGKRFSWLESCFTDFMDEMYAFAEAQQQPHEGTTDRTRAEKQETSTLEVTGHYHTIFSNNDTRDAFANFLSEIFMQLDVPKFFSLIDDILKPGMSDTEVYARLSSRIGECKLGILSRIQAQTRALSNQQEVFKEQVKQFMGDVSKIKDYLEIGFPGRFVKPLKSLMGVEGPVYAVKDGESFTDFLEGGLPLPYDTFQPLNDYARIDEKDIPSWSVELATCMIGLHHCPKDKLQDFVGSIHRILKPGGTFILRDHDAHTPEMQAMAYVVHSVFNAATGVSAEEDAHEYRNFRELDYWIQLLEDNGFKLVSDRLMQDRDPSLNYSMRFIKVATESELQLQQIKETLAKTEGYNRELLQTFLTAPEWQIVDISNEYAKFIEHTPFYEFPYFQNIALFWKVFGDSWNAAREDHSLWDVATSEYTLMNGFIGASLTAEYALKGLVSAPMAYWYGSEQNKAADKITLLVDDPNNNVGAIDKRIIVRDNMPSGGIKVIEVPRSRPFTDIMVKLAQANVPIVEIAGKREIQLKVRAATHVNNLCDNLSGCRQLYEWPILSDPDHKHVALRVSTAELGHLIKTLQSRGIEITHFHDF